MDYPVLIVLSKIYLWRENRLKFDLRTINLGTVTEFHWKFCLVVRSSS